VEAVKRDGCYAIKRPSGEAFIAQVHDGRLVELLQTRQTGAPPKRTTTKRLGDSIHEVIVEHRRKREQKLREEMHRELLRDLEARGARRR
jgi:hypothetical protein